MKHVMIAIALLSGQVLAQSPVGSVRPATGSPGNGPSYSQLHCSGFLSRRPVAHSSYIAGSKESPHEGQFSSHEQLLIGGRPLTPGERYSVLRQVSDPNREDSAPEERKRLEKLGSLYQEVGWVTVQSVLGHTSVASFDFACDSAIAGDIVVPFEEKPQISYRKFDPPVDSFQARSNAPKGAILASKDFEQVLGSGRIVYTDFGINKGAKPGAYLTVLRGYAPEDLNRVDRLSNALTGAADPAGTHPVKIAPDMAKSLPQHVLGELMVLTANENSSTAIVMRSFAEMQLGDLVQSEDANAEPLDPVCKPATYLQRMMIWKRHRCSPDEAMVTPPQPAPAHGN